MNHLPITPNNRSSGSPAASSGKNRKAKDGIAAGPGRGKGKAGQALEPPKKLAVDVPMTGVAGDGEGDVVVLKEPRKV